MPYNPRMRKQVLKWSVVNASQWDASRASWGYSGEAWKLKCFAEVHQHDLEVPAASLWARKTAPTTTDQIGADDQTQ